jgi:hypothetical protein
VSEDPITLADTKRAGLCIKGMREFIEKDGVNFKDFARNGIPVETARAIPGWGAMVDHVLKTREDRRG